MVPSLLGSNTMARVASVGGGAMTGLFRRVLVPHDFSPSATRAFRVAADLAVRHGGRLVVLHAIPPMYPILDLPPEAYLPPRDPQLIERVRQRLAASVAREIRGRRKPRVDCRVVVADPLRAIMQAAREASVIVMGTVGRTGMPRVLLGSVAEKTVRHSLVPVLTVGPGGRLRRASRSRRRSPAGERQRRGKR
jgi:nucleotide-binding universal stress UspA family protein